MYATIKRRPRKQLFSCSWFSINWNMERFAAELYELPLQETAVNEPIRSRQSSPSVPIPPPVPPRRSPILREQYQLAKEMGFSESSLQRLIEKHEYKAFDDINDLITAFDAMKVAEQREELYGK